MTHRVLESTLAFEGKLLHLRVDQVEYPSGRIGSLEIVEHPGAVAIIPIDDEGNVWLVEQYRYPVKRFVLEIPAGTLDPEETPEDCAFRECREEISMAPGELVALGSGFIAPGYSTENLHFFLARAMTRSPLQPDPDEHISIIKIPLEDALRYSLAQPLQDVKTIAGLALAIAYLDQAG